jgi:hypothetical protein
MPYYKNLNSNDNILFIHIPKTGGSSIEKYLRINHTENIYSSTPYNNIIPCDYCKNHSLQHQEYKYLYKYKDILNINFDDKLLIFTIVRNPYDRIISELFWNRKKTKINKNSTKDDVYKILLEYFMKGDKWDNHEKTQYSFLEDDNGNIIKNIIILKTENLEEEFKKIGFNDYKSPKSINKNYMKYLNENSIKLINEKYEKDFKFFNYKML